MSHALTVRETCATDYIVDNADYKNWRQLRTEINEAAMQRATCHSQYLASSELMWQRLCKQLPMFSTQ